MARLQTLQRFEPGAALARINADGLGWTIDCRGPYGASLYTFDHEGEAAEFAVMLRDEGGWALRYMPSAVDLEAVVAEITHDTL